MSELKNKRQIGVYKASQPARVGGVGLGSRNLSWRPNKATTEWFLDEVMTDSQVDQWVGMSQRQNPDLFVTLTYDRSPRNGEEAIRNVRKFMQRLRSAPTMKGRHYWYLHVADVQPQLGRKLHHHLIVFIEKTHKPICMTTVKKWIWMNWKVFRDEKVEIELMPCMKRRKMTKREVRLKPAGIVEVESFDPERGGIGYILRKHQYRQIERCCPCKKGAPHYCRESGKCNYDWSNHK